ncbi:MAG: NAD-dependent epimerase/dehydratase family protein [Gaiellaceae bacterium]
MGTTLITGGAGFVGANIALRLAAEDHDVVALDNLKRRGSELNLPRLQAGGVRFVHGDVRALADLEGIGAVDTVVECSAEPSALAGLDGSTAYLLDSNLRGAYQCFDFARRRDAQVVFLSTSRVYPYGSLGAANLVEGDTRFALAERQESPGLTALGVSENFSLEGPRTLYGATKLAAELVLTEYGAAFDVPWTVNRCGVVAGPWQMGKADQGVFVHWARAHWFGTPLAYIGYGGNGKQVRDLLHVDDLADLVVRQLASPADWRGVVANVGGGLEISLSLLETTALCRELTGRTVPIEPEPNARPGDVPLYVSDCSRLYARTDWRPRRDAETIMGDIVAWIKDNEDDVRRLPA